MTDSVTALELAKLANQTGSRLSRTRFTEEIVIKASLGRKTVMAIPFNAEFNSSVTFRYWLAKNGQLYEKSRRDYVWVPVRVTVLSEKTRQALAAALAAIE